MAAGHEHGCRAGAWEEGFPACPVLLLPGGALGLLLAWQSKQGWQWQGAAGGQKHGHSLFLLPGMSWSRDPALACLLALPAWSWCPKPFSAHRLQCWSSHWSVQDCERRGL